MKETWIRSHEEDDKNFSYFRKKGFVFQPARFRNTFVLDYKTKTFSWVNIAPTCGTITEEGTFIKIENLLTLNFKEKTVYYEILVEGDRMGMREMGVNKS